MVKQQDIDKIHETLAVLIQNHNHNKGQMDALVTQVNRMSATLDDLCKTTGAIGDAVNMNKKKIDTLEEEMIWRERKKRQVICHGIPESKAATGEKRADDDKANLAEVLDCTKANLTMEDVKFTRRVGKATVGKDRPLCVGFYDEWTKDRLLRFSKNLKGTKRNDVKIWPDFTQAQRQLFKDQMEVAKTRNASKEGLQAGQEWRVVGAKGDTRLIRVMIQK